MKFSNLFHWRFANLLEHKNAPSLTSGVGLEDITETCFSSEADGCRLDEEKGIFYNAKIRGRRSENGHDYEPQCDADGVRLYEGAEINIDHPPKGKEGVSRLMEEGWGVARKVTVDPAGGNRGDVHFLKSHPITEQIIERYKKGFPLGLSHNAVGKTAVRNGRRVVEGLHSVRSIDLVRRPATTTSLKESLDSETTVGEWAVLFETNDAELAALVEAMAADPKASPAPMNYSPQQTGDPGDDGLKSAVLAAITAKVSTADQATLKKVLKALDIEDSMSANASGTGATDQPTTEALEALTEHVKADPALAGHVKTLTEALATKAKPVEEVKGEKTLIESLTEKVNTLETKYTATEKQLVLAKFMESEKLSAQSLGADRMKLLEACADNDARKVLVKTWPASVKGIAPPRGQLQNVTESIAAAPKTAGDVRAMLRG